jgi:hypothetical protein
METPPETGEPPSEIEVPKAGGARGKIFLAIVLIVAVGLAVALSGRPRPVENRIPVENREILAAFFEDFTGENLESLEAQGWSVWYKPRMDEIIDSEVPFKRQTVSVTENWMLEVGEGSGAGGFMYSADWSDYTLTYKFKTNISPSRNFWCGFAFRTDDTWESGAERPEKEEEFGKWPQNSYIVQMGWGTNYNTYRFWKIVGGEWTLIKSVDRPTTPASLWRDNWHDVRLEARGASLKIYFDNELLFDEIDNSLASGGIGLLNCGGPVYFDDVAVNPYG